jgi:hypothetical protein
MLTRRDAFIAAEKVLADLAPLPDGDTWMLLTEETIERPFGWVFFYGSSRFAETGDLRHAVAGNSPFIVNRRTGAIVATGTAYPVEHYIAQYEAQLREGV